MSDVLQLTSGANKDNLASNLPYPALKLIFWFVYTTPGEALATAGTVCSRWRSILTVTGVLWESFTLERWPGTSPKNCSFETFIERMRKAHALRPIRPRDTTAIEDCDFAFRCPLLIENLSLVHPAPLVENKNSRDGRGGPHSSSEYGPIYHCSVCNKNVYTVTTEAAKQACAEDGKCVVFRRNNVAGGASVRIRVAIVSKFTEEDEKNATTNNDGEGAAKASAALREIRAFADLLHCTSTVSVVDRVIVDLGGSPHKAAGTTEFRHVLDRDLWDPKKKRSGSGAAPSSAAAASSSAPDFTPPASRKERPFVPDVVLYVDNDKMKPNWSPHNGSQIFGIRLGHTSATVANFPLAGSQFGTCATPLPNEHGNQTTPNVALYDVEDSQWVLGPVALTQRARCHRFFVPDLLALMAMTSQSKAQAYLEKYPWLDPKLAGGDGVSVLPTEDGVYLNASSVSSSAAAALSSSSSASSSSRQITTTDPFGFDVVVASQIVARITTLELATMMFSRLRATFLQNTVGEEDSDEELRCVLSLPYSVRGDDASYEQTRERMRQCAEASKLTFARVCHDPAMAGMAYGIDRKNDSPVIRSLHIHCGGTSLEATVVDIDEGIFEVMDTAAGAPLGSFCGELLDQILVEYVMEHLLSSAATMSQKIRASPKAMLRLRRACERARITLSSATSTTVEVDGLLPDFDLSVGITRSKLDMLCDKELRSSVDKIVTFLRSVKNTTPQQVDYVVLSGGVCRMPRFKHVLEQTFTKPGQLLTTVNPEVAGAIGAATIAAILCGDKKKRPRPLCAPWKDATQAFALAATAATPDENDFFMGILDVMVLTVSVGDASTGMSVPVIRRNTVFPARKSVTLVGSQLAHVTQPATGTAAATAAAASSSDHPAAAATMTILTSIVDVYEGERSASSDNRHLGQIVMPHLVAPRSEVTVTFDMDPNGILVCSAAESGRPLNHATITIANDDGHLTNDEIERMVVEAERYKAEDDALRARVEAKNKLENAAYSLRMWLLHPPPSDTSSSDSADDDSNHEQKKNPMINKPLDDETKVRLANLVEETLKYIEETDIWKMESEQRLRVLEEAVLGIFPASIFSDTPRSGMPGGMPGGGVSSAAYSGPSVEEVD